MRALAAALLLIAGFAGQAGAHVTELAVLRLTELDTGRYTVAWELKPNTDVGEALEPIFPDHCEYGFPIVDCGGRGLTGRLGFERIGAGQSAAMFKIRSLDGATQVYTLTPAEPTAQVIENFEADSWAGRAQIFGAYTQIGIEHILLGIDHLLFVLGLMWIAPGRWTLFKTITAFTVAHSLTLGAVTFGWVGVPEPFVNAMIALSIVFIGVEMHRLRAGGTSYTLENPWVVAFAFGLLHGFGFANALVQLGLPEDARPLALLAFNIGVEIGQIGFVFLVLALIWAYRVMRVAWPRWSETVPLYAIGGLAAFWFLDRSLILIGG